MATKSVYHRHRSLIDKYQDTAGEFVPEETQEPDEADVPARKLTIDSTLAALKDNPDTMAILHKHIPDTASNTDTPGFLTLRSLFSLAGDRIDQSKLPLIETDFNKLYGE